MNKKAYMKPTMQTVELNNKTMILTGSPDEYGMNKKLTEDEEVESAWSRSNKNVWDDEEDEE